MNLSRWKVMSAGSVLVLCAVLALDLAVAQPKPAARGKAAAAAKPKGRLPAYYADVVDEKQRAAIYSIQADFKSKIEALQEQIDKLTAERDTAIESVLTAAQKDKVKKAREAALAKRKKSADKPEEKPAKEESPAE